MKRASLVPTSGEGLGWAVPVYHVFPEAEGPGVLGRDWAQPAPCRGHGQWPCCLRRRLTGICGTRLVSPRRKVRLFKILTFI